MPDISVVEIAFYGFIELFSLSMLIISVAKEIPDSKKHVVLRAIFLVPGMLAAGMLAGSGPNVVINTIITNSTSLANSTWTNSTAHSDTLVILQNPMWGMFHMMIFLVLFVFILFRTISMLEKRD